MLAPLKVPEIALSTFSLFFLQRNTNESVLAFQFVPSSGTISKKVTVGDVGISPLAL